MKVEIDLNGKQVARVLVIVAIGIVIGFALGISTVPVIAGNSQAASSSGYLTGADFNTGLGASIMLSRFCEGLGLQSSVLWQQDEQGNVYGVPICLEAQ